MHIETNKHDNLKTSVLKNTTLLDLNIKKIHVFLQFYQLCVLKFNKRSNWIKKSFSALFFVINFFLCCWFVEH